ncbi:Protein hunchback [Schistosoma japonicum]|nr:Protein hunchback [Schistosoma japonicum]
MIEAMADFSRSEISSSSNIYLELNTEPQFHSLWCILPPTNDTPYSTPCKENHLDDHESAGIRNNKNDNVIPRISDLNNPDNLEQTVPLISIKSSVPQNKSISLYNSNDKIIPNNLNDTKLHQNSKSLVLVKDTIMKQTIRSSEIPVKQNVISQQFPTSDFAVITSESQHCDANSYTNDVIPTNNSAVIESNEQTNTSTEEVFQEGHPSAQSSYHEESSENTRYCLEFDTFGADHKHTSAFVNTVHTVNETQQYTETSSDNSFLKHNLSCSLIDHGTNLNQHACPQPEINISAKFPTSSIHNTTDEHISLEISSETQRAMESSNSTPPSTENNDIYHVEKFGSSLTPQHSPLTKQTLGNQTINSNWNKGSHLNSNCSQSNHPKNELQNACCFNENTNEHVFLDYTDANPTDMQSPSDFTYDQTGHSMASSDEQSSADESDEGMSLANFEQFTNSMQPNHAGLYFCHLCDFAGNSRQEFQDHLLSHYDYKCLKCDYTSRTEGRLKRHMKDFHSDVPPENFSGKTIRSLRPKLQRCKQCDFVTDTKDEFWRHLRIHIKEDKRLECHLCCFITEYKHHLEYHMRNHMGSKPYKCPKCNYECVNKSMLNSHMKSHSNVYPYRCANCHYATKYCHSLKLHLTKHEHKPSVVLNSDGSLPPYDNTVELMNVKRGPNIRHGNSKLNGRHRNSSDLVKSRMKGSSVLRNTTENITHVSSTPKCSSSEIVAPNKDYQSQTIENQSDVNMPISVVCTSPYDTNQPMSAFQTFKTTESSSTVFSSPTFSTPILFSTFTSANNVPTRFMEAVNSITSESLPDTAYFNDVLNTSGNMNKNSSSSFLVCKSEESNRQSIPVTSDPFLNYSVSAYSSMVAFMAAMQCRDFNQARLISSDSTNLSELTNLNFVTSNSLCSTDISDTLPLVKLCTDTSTIPSISSDCKEYIQNNQLYNNIFTKNITENNYSMNISSSLNENTTVVYSSSEMNSAPICSSSIVHDIVPTSNKCQSLQENQIIPKKSMKINEINDKSTYANLEKIKNAIPNKTVHNDIDSALDLSSSSYNKRSIDYDKFHKPTEYNFKLDISEVNEQILQNTRYEKNHVKTHHEEPSNIKSSVISLTSSTIDRISNNSTINIKDQLDFNHECRFCEIRFRHRTLYDIHMGFHSHSDPYLCNRCGHQSNDSVEFFTHLGEEAHYS